MFLLKDKLIEGFLKEQDQSSTAVLFQELERRWSIISHGANILILDPEFYWVSVE
ncbi:MAG TPA: hypothetical protein P5246_05860 [Candidatus Omnitrophota bacterium]|nr:hypothetical protein [Candidatus Omnitrophota bacterium]